MHFYTDALRGVTFDDFPVNVDRVRDNNLRTFWHRTTDNDPGDTVFFSWTVPAGVAPVQIDAVLLLCEGSSNWRVNRSSDRSTDDGNATPGLGFRRLLIDTEIATGATNLRITVPDGGKLYEVYVLKDAFSTANEQRPMRYRRTGVDPRTSAYYSESSELISYGGLSPGAKNIIQIGWDYLPDFFFLREKLREVPARLRISSYTDSDLMDDTLDELKTKFQTQFSQEAVTLIDFEDLFLGPPLRAPFFIYPEPVNRPREAYRVYWEGEFAPRPTQASLASGYTLDMNLIET